MYEMENIKHQQHDLEYKIVLHERIKRCIIHTIIQVIAVVNVAFERIVQREQVVVQDVLVDIQAYLDLRQTLSVI